LCSSLKVRDQVSRAYRSTGKIIGLYFLIYRLKTYDFLVKTPVLVSNDRFESNYMFRNTSCLSSSQVHIGNMLPLTAVIWRPW
jgi:hypothetical protein